MAYIVGEDFTEQLYSGESIFRATLKINDVTIPNDQIASISISSPIIDDSKQVFYIGSFISQKITIHFKNMDNIAVESGQEVSLSIGQYVLDELDPESSEWVDIPIGKFLIDDLAEDYYEKCEISCLDYAVKFKPNVDYSECFTNGKATIKKILQYVCEHCGVLLGDYPEINDDVEIGTYDSTVSGKQWISYIAEIKGCNAKIDREGKLTLQPLKQPSKVSINALESASFDKGERFKISQVTYFDAIRNFTFGNDTDNTLFIRQDNPFINDENVVKNIYESIVNEKHTTSGTDLDLDNTDEYNIILNTIYGDTSQNTLSGKNLWGIADQTFRHCGIDVTIKDGVITLNGTTNGVGVKQLDVIVPTTTATGLYTLSKNEISGTKDESGGTGNFNVRNNDTGSFIFSCALSETNKSYNITSATPIKFGLYLQSGCTYNNYKFKPQLELGGNVTSYEQYCGGIPSPNPDYPQNVNTVTGRNVVNVRKKNKIGLQNGTYSQNDLTITVDNGILNVDGTASATTSVYIPLTNPVTLDVGKTNTFRASLISGSVQTANQIAIRMLTDINGGSSFGDTWKTLGVANTYTQTENQTFKSVLFRINANYSTTNAQIGYQLETGSTATDYEAYQSQEQEIDLGKNLFDGKLEQGNYNASGVKINDTATYRNANMVKVKPNTTYTLSIDGVSHRYCLFYYTDNGTYISQNLSLTTGTFTTPANCGNVNFRCFGADYTSDFANLKVQLEQGSTATTYAPYYRVSKNLFNPSNVLVGYNIYTNGSAQTQDARNSLNYTEVKENTTYKLSGLDVRNIAFYDANKNTISYVSTQNTFTTPANTRYIRFGFVSTVDWSRAQVEEGPTATPYEPYDKHIELCKIGNYQDYITKNTGANIFEPMLTYEGTEIAHANCNVYLNGDEYILTSTGTDIYFSQVTNQGSAYQNNRGKLYTIGNNDKVYVYSTNVEFTRNYITWYDENKISLGYDYSAGLYNKEFTVPANAKYFTIRFGLTGYNNTTYKTRIMVSFSPITSYEPYGQDEWYVYNNIFKHLITSNNIGGSIGGIDSTKGYIRLYIDKKKKYANEANVHQFVYCSHLHTINMPNAEDNSDKIGIMNTGAEREFRIRLNKGELNIQNTKDYFDSNIVYLYYVSTIPEVRKITYQPLIDQLNAVDSLKTYEGKTYITSRGVEENGPVDIDYYKNSNFELYSVKTRNYGDFTLDAWDNIEYDLDGVKYNTLNNNNITYEMTVMSDVDTKIPTKQQTVTTNIIGGDDSVNIKKIKTEVDNLNATATILAQQTTNNSSEISQLQVNVSSIQNLFTLTGGINLIRNSAFLLTDAVWTFTDNGLNPYHTELGNSFDISTTGKTVSISEIKLQDVIAKTTNDNITSLKTDGTAYTLNFYYKQDENTTTTIKMYDKNNTSAKAFDDIVLTGQSDFTNYSVSFVPNSSDYLIEISTATIVASGSFYLYDLMLNSGDIQPWQPASDEIYSTTLSMSRQGLKVYSVGDGTITLLGSDGLLSYETTDGKTLGKLVSQRTVDGDKIRRVDTQSIELGQDITSDSADRWLETTVVIDGNLHKVLYLESGD